MNQYYRKLQPMLTLCILLCVLLGLGTPVHATTQLSITVEYIYDDQPIEDVEVEIYLVALWQNGQYVLTEEFSDSNIDFSNLTAPSDWRDEGESLDGYIHDEDCLCDDCQHTDSSGTAYFSQLSYGIYYVDVADADYEDGTLISDPVLLTLPAYDNATDTYTYDIVMEPKVAFIADPDTPTKPKDPDDPNFEIPDPDTPGGGRDSDDPDLPQTGTSAWLIVPLALMGFALTALDLTLPVASSWSYTQLKSTPCIYQGTLVENNLVIIAHNYDAHFGNLNQLQLGDELSLLDGAGITHSYTVTEKLTLDETDVDALSQGNWDLTLFTCYYGNNDQRVVLRLTQITS